jgi:hypothetical protein
VVGCHRVCWCLGFCDGSGGEGCGYWRFCLCCGVLVMMALLEDRVVVAMGVVRLWGVTAGLWLFELMFVVAWLGGATRRCCCGLRDGVVGARCGSVDRERRRPPC